jgi:pyruvate,water dikinase
MKEELTKPFVKLSKDDAGIAGGKGASLGEMTNAGIPVPPGFVVLATTFDKFIHDTDIAQEIDAELDKINLKEMESVEETSEVIRGLIESQEMTKELKQEILAEFDKLNCEFVAVRSSATAEDASDASWAGELESYLNVKRDGVCEYVQRCWGSLFTPRAIFYRIEKKLHGTKISVAVVIQKMVKSEVSGICFTVHPVTTDPKQMIIEAGYGLGEAIVGGLITPDSYVVDKVSGGIIDKNISTQEMMIVKGKDGLTKQEQVASSKKDKQKISGEKIKEITKVCMSIERHYKKPQDIEWALEKNKLYIVQSRPITTL